MFRVQEWLAFSLLPQVGAVAETSLYSSYIVSFPFQVNNCQDRGTVKKNILKSKYQHVYSYLNNKLFNSKCVRSFMRLWIELGQFEIKKKYSFYSLMNTP